MKHNVQVLNTKRSKRVLTIKISEEWHPDETINQNSAKKNYEA